MFDFGAINKSAESMAQAATDIVSRLESIENLAREQNALLGILILQQSDTHPVATFEQQLAVSAVARLRFTNER